LQCDISANALAIRVVKCIVCIASAKYSFTWNNTTQIRVLYGNFSSASSEQSAKLFIFDSPSKRFMRSQFEKNVSFWLKDGILHK
jgi:hypothetical protein